MGGHVISYLLCHVIESPSNFNLGTFILYYIIECLYRYIVIYMLYFSLYSELIRALKSHGISYLLCHVIELRN
jgi:hypothetical protein